MSRLGFVAGLIQQEKLTSFERLLFRATRGNMFLKSAAVGRVQVCLSDLLCVCADVRKAEWAAC